MTIGVARAGIDSRDALPSLTGLRFWAALLVVLYHLGNKVGPIEPITSMVQYGRTGVTFFFVLSGFVLAWTYLDRRIAYSAFLWRRFARIWPLTLVTGLLSLAAYGLIGQDILPPRALSTFVLLQAWLPTLVPGANPAAWSLSDEAFFYVLFPLLLPLATVPRLRPHLWAAVVLALVTGWLLFGLSDARPWVIDFFPPSRLVQFVAGILAAVAMRQGARAPIAFLPAVGLVIGYHAALIVWGSAVPESSGGGFGAHSGSQWWALPVFVLLVASAAQADIDGRRTGVSGAWSIKLGHWSFALYLIHEPIVRMWTHYVSTGPVVLTWIVLGGLSTAAAAALYAWVEHPAERALRSRMPQSKDGGGWGLRHQRRR